MLDRDTLMSHATKPIPSQYCHALKAIIQCIYGAPANIDAGRAVNITTSPRLSRYCRKSVHQLYKGDILAQKGTTFIFVSPSKILRNARRCPDYLRIMKPCPPPATDAEISGLVSVPALTSRITKHRPRTHLGWSANTGLPL